MTPYLILLAVATHAAVVPDCRKYPALTPVECGCDTAKGPATYALTFHSTKGPFTVNVDRADAPIGADRLYSMARCGYLGNDEVNGNEGGFFRVVPGFVVQWGISGNTSVSGPWENLIIPNDKPNKLSNIRGTLSYAAMQDQAGMAVNRTTQIFINFADNSRLDALGFTPIGVISEADMANVVDKISAKWGEQPDQDAIYAQGNAYLKKTFPGLDYANNVTLH